MRWISAALLLIITTAPVLADGAPSSQSGGSDEANKAGTAPDGETHAAPGIKPSAAISPAAPATSDPNSADTSCNVVCKKSLQTKLGPQERAALDSCEQIETCMSRLLLSPDHNTAEVNDPPDSLLSPMERFERLLRDIKDHKV